MFLKFCLASLIAFSSHQVLAQDEGMFLAGHVAHLDADFQTSYSNFAQSNKYNPYVISRLLDSAYLNEDWSNVLELAKKIASFRDLELVTKSHALEFLVVNALYSEGEAELYLDRMEEISDFLKKPLPIVPFLLKAWVEAKEGRYKKASKMLQKPPIYVTKDIALFGPILATNRFFIEKLGGMKTQNIEDMLDKVDNLSGIKKLFKRKNMSFEQTFEQNMFVTTQIFSTLDWSKASVNANDLEDMKRSAVRISLWKKPDIDEARIWKSKIYLQLKNNRTKNHYESLIKEELKSVSKASPSYNSIRIFLEKMNSGEAEDKSVFVQKILNLIQNSDDVNDYEQAAEILTEWKVYDKAISIYDRTIKTFPQHKRKWVWLYNKASIYQILKRPWAQIEEVVRKALGIKRDPIVLNMLGYGLAEENINLEEARQLLEECILKESKNGAYLDSMGWVLHKLGEYGQSNFFLSMASSYLPNSFEVIDHLAQSFEKIGLKKHAEFQWKSLKKIELSDEEKKTLESRLKKYGF